MRRRRASLALLAVVATFTVAMPSASGAEAGRIWGSSRIHTAAAVARHAFPDGAPTAYLARSDVSADALAAGSLSDGPVLLVPSCGDVPAPVAEEVARLGPQVVVALGGSAAVCDQLLHAVAGPRSTERVSGPTRAETAVAVAQRAYPGGAGTVYLARADDSPDAVAGGSLTDGPILLVPSTGPVPPAVVAEIDRLSAGRVVALGGEAAVSDQVLADAARGRTTARLAGATRIETAAAIATTAFPSFSVEVYLARSDVFADAVAAGSLTQGPVLLVPSCGELPAAVSGALERLSPARVWALGGTAAVCDDVLIAAQAAAGRGSQPRPGDPLIVPDTTQVLDDVQRAALRAYTPDGTLRFDAARVPTTAFAPGDVLVSAPAQHAPDGLLREVIEVRVDGADLIVATRSAQLTDAVHRGRLEATAPLSPAHVVSSTPLPAGVTSRSTVSPSGARTGASLVSGWSYELDHFVLFDLDGDPATADDQVFADGAVDVAVSFLPEIDIEARWSFPPAYIERASFVVEAVEDASITVTAHYAGSWERTRNLVTHHFAPFTFFIGPVPVVLTPTLAIDVGASGAIEATLTWGADQHASLSAGAEYRDGEGWSPVEVADFDFTHREPAFDGAAEARASTSARVSVELYGIAGPFIEARIHVRASAVTDPCPVLGVHAGIAADVGLAADVPGLDELPELDLRVLDNEVPLAEFEEPCTEPAGYRWSGQMTFSDDTTFHYDGYTEHFEYSATFVIPEGTVPAPAINYDAYDGTLSFTYKLTRVYSEFACTETITASSDGMPSELLISQWIDQPPEEGAGAFIWGDATVTFVLDPGSCYWAGVEWHDRPPDAYVRDLGLSQYLASEERWSLTGSEQHTPAEATGAITSSWSLTSPTGPGREPRSY